LRGELDQAGADGVLDDVPRDRERRLVACPLLCLVHEFVDVRLVTAPFDEKMGVIGHQAGNVGFAGDTQNLPQHDIAHVMRHEYAAAVRRAERQEILPHSDVECRIESRQR
jgi:hypothetical protein